LDASIAYELLSVTSEDHREAMAALKEKRKPTFTGK
jgi:enoyl-CoA hydratase